MLLVSKLLSQLLLPPGGLILLALLGVIFWKRVWARGLLVCVCLMFWALSTEPVRDGLSRPLEFQYAALHLLNRDIEHGSIVLLGGGIYANAPEYDGEDALESHAMMRTLYAAKLYKQTRLDVYATGGAPLGQGDDAEADVMRRWLVDLGVDEADVFTESHANNTWQNATYIKALLTEKQVQTVVLVTSAWHMPRAVWCFEAQGLKVVPAPTDYITLQKSYDLRSYFPSAHVFSDSVLALHEYLGLLWYHISYA